MVAIEKEYGVNEVKQVRKKILDFYLNTTETNPDYKFYLKKYDEV